MHRLHNATVGSAAHDSDSEADERLAMVIEGSLTGGLCGADAGGLTAVLLDTRATANFVSPRLQRVAITYSSSPDDSSTPILGRVRLSLKLQSFKCTVTCYVIDLCEQFTLFLGTALWLV